MSGEVRLAVLSDTHGRLTEDVRRACAGAERILHAGDVGGGVILDLLEEAAPVTAVAGNVDPPDEAPLRATVEAGGWRVLVQHIVWSRGGPSGEVLDLLGRQGADLVVFGHTHQPLCQRTGGTVFLNPGSCGPRRFSLPRTYAEALLSPREGCFRIFDLDAPPGAPPLREVRFPRG
ncbi:MAG: metallophosphoesterase family protein [bacterium]